MNFRIVLIVLYFCLTIDATAQQVIFGTNNYVEYQVGTLPIIISVSHGGSLEPTEIPNRTCNNPVYATDVSTIETALEIKNYLFAATGCYPHLIISHLKRNKLDPNRNIADGACGNSAAETAWNEFHNFISVASNAANLQYSNKTLLVDLHGHGNPIQRIELGYLLYDDELELADTVLNSNQYINFSSIKNLVLNNVNNYTHIQLLRGQKSFGTLLSINNFPSVPSQSIPFPGTTTNYFSGGYIIANHTSYISSVTTNGFQMELNYSGIRDSNANRALFANAFTLSFIEFMNTHFATIWNSCTPLAINNIALHRFAEFYPNPVKRGEVLNFDFLADATYNYTIYNVLGYVVKKGQLSAQMNTINFGDSSSGIYLIQIHNTQNNFINSIKIIVD